MTVWHWLVHSTGSDYGAHYGQWVPYSFWSGVAGSFAVAVIAGLVAWLHRRLSRHAAAMAENSETADKALRIAADTHKALTGLDHPDAPPPTTEES